jgi:hypothetical protein
VKGNLPDADVGRVESYLKARYALSWASRKLHSPGPTGELVPPANRIRGDVILAALLVQSRDRSSNFLRHTSRTHRPHDVGTERMVVMLRHVLTGSLFLAIAACGAAEDPAGADESNATSGISPTAIGEYKLSTDSVGATLKILGVSPFRFDLTIVRKGGGGAQGDIKDAIASVDDGRATFAPDDDCSIVLRPRADGVEVRQTGACKSEGFGAFVDGTGLYRKGASSATTAVPISGKFTLKEDKGIASHFAVTSATATELVFDLTAVLAGPSSRNGEIRGGKAALDGSKATYTPGPDCTITFAFDEKRTAADLEQVGRCAEEAGFGAFVDVTGHYEK